MAYTVIFNLFMFVCLAASSWVCPALTSYGLDTSRARWTRLPTSTHWRDTRAPADRWRWSQSVRVSVAREEDGHKLSLSLLSTWIWCPYILDACAQYCCSKVRRCDWLGGTILASDRAACYDLSMHCIRVSPIFGVGSAFSAMPLGALFFSSIPARLLQAHSARRTA